MSYEICGFLFFCFIIAGSIIVVLTDYAVKFVVQRRIAGHDECEDGADPYTLLCSVKHRDDDYFRRIDLKSFTCTLCCDQNHCEYAYDLYCTDGDCLANK